MAFKEALNRQTYPQFKEYAVQQYPQSVEQQEQLIHQLQGQHFLQYVQQMMQSQTDPQNFYAQQEQRVQLKTRTETNQNNNAFGSPSEQETLISTRQQFSDLNMNGDCNDSGSIKTSPSYNSPSSSSHELQCETKIQESNSIQNGSFSGSTKNLAHVKDTSIYPLHMSNNEEENEQQTEDEGANDEEEDDDNKEVEISIAAPQIWTKKIIKSFKESIAKDSGDGIIKIGHGEVLTVRVPTHCNGNCIVWEFATDSYDIGFGLLFEWNQNPGEDVTVHISESEDDDDEEEDDEEDDDEEVKASTSDPERGTLRTRSHSSTMETVVRHVGPSTSHDLPISVIIPIYRRDCHEEVYAGSHVYPGKGAYLLKFDNTYSLWRAKTLYYRVYYTN